MERLAIRALERGIEVRAFKPENSDRPSSGNKTLLELGARAYSAPPVKGVGRASNNRAISIAKGSRVLTGLADDSYLIHFTRSCPGPWPGQGLDDFYRALLEAREGAAHTAFDTLFRILTERRVKASGRLIRGGHRVVSFTAQGLKDLRELVRWRRGLIRWTFEPYGVAVPRDDLVKLGAARVIYGGQDDWKNLSKDEKYRFQYHHPPETDWSVEKEWRLPGDLDLSLLSPDRIKVIVPSQREAELMAGFGFEVVLTTGFDSGVSRKKPARTWPETGSPREEDCKNTQSRGLIQ